MASRKRTPTVAAVHHQHDFADGTGHVDCEPWGRGECRWTCKVCEFQGFGEPGARAHAEAHRRKAAS